MVHGEHLRALGLGRHELADQGVGGQGPAARPASADQVAQIAAVFAPRVIAVIVGYRQGRVDRVRDRSVQGIAIRASVSRPRAR